MDWQIGLAEDGRYLLVTTGGRLTLADQQRMFDELGALPAPDTRPRILFDNRQLNLDGSNLDVVTQSVQIVQRFIDEHRVERLAGLVNQGANFGVGRQFETLTDLAGGHGFRLFKDEALALCWLRGEVD